MSLISKFKQKGVLYSCVYGSGIYRVTNQFVQDPFSSDDGSSYSPLLQNEITGEQFYMRLMNCTPEMDEKYKERIKNPPRRNHILWPTDMVDLQDEEIECSLYVFQKYTDTPDTAEGVSFNRGLLFPYDEYPVMKNGVNRLKEIKKQTWKNKEIRRIAYQLLKAVDEVNRSGYVYQDIHLSRIYFLDHDEVNLDFSGLAIPIADTLAEDTETQRFLKDDEYPLEFADPAVYNGMHHTLDFDSQNYSLTALLFYLFIGIYPYDGRLLTGFVDDSIQKHYVKFRNYLKMPVFVFDPDDQHNALGIFAEDEEVIDLWNELPDELKPLFIKTLRQSNAKRETEVSNPTPSMWIAYFDELGWNKEIADA